MVGGVCAGIADYFSTDVTLVRVIAALIAVISGGN
jgi:phage shock protein PspC (stress-responsive transcriptional regulator)